MSPRKSSTSSAEPSKQRLRPRYLGLEVAGELLPPLSPRAWESLISERLSVLPPPPLRFRLIRSDGRRAVVEVDHRSALPARDALGSPRDETVGPALVTRRTWGTLLGAKAWLRASSS